MIADSQTIPVPEPELRPQEMIARAEALIPAIRSEQDESERREFHEDQRVYGLATGMTDAAETVLYAFGREYLERATQAVDSGERIPLTDRWLF